MGALPLLRLCGAIHPGYLLQEKENKSVVPFSLARNIPVSGAEPRPSSSVLQASLMPTKCARVPLGLNRAWIFGEGPGHSHFHPEDGSDQYALE